MCTKVVCIAVVCGDVVEWYVNERGVRGVQEAWAAQSLTAAARGAGAATAALASGARLRSAPACARAAPDLAAALRDFGAGLRAHVAHLTTEPHAERAHRYHRFYFVILTLTE